MTYYPHLNATNVDWAHRDAVLYAHRCARGEYGSAIYDSAALSMADNQDTTLEVGVYVRAYSSTRRALEVEAADIRESERRLWLARTGRA